MKRSIVISIVLCLFLSVTALSSAQGSQLNIVATTTLIADVARQVGGDLVTVTSLIPPDSDVHAFQPTTNDVVMVAEADVLLVNGAGLEVFLGNLLNNAGTVEPIVVSNGVPMLAFGEPDEDEASHGQADTIGILGTDAACDEAHDHEEANDADEHEHGSCDPHVWADIANVKIWADNIAEAFSAADPDNAETYRANAESYKEILDALSIELDTLVDSLPEDKRILVTNHEFLGYFAARYDFKIVGIVVAGGTTLSEPSPQDLAALITTINTTGAPAIFAEVSDPGLLAEVIQGEVDHPIEIVHLYSGSLSAEDGPAATYIDYMRYNTQTIIDALSN